MAAWLFLAVSFAVPSGDRPVEMGPALEVLADPQRSLSVDQARVSPAFAPLGTPAHSWGYTHAAYWARFELVNPGPTPVVSILELTDAVTRADLILDGQPPRRSGNELPFLSREVLSRNISFRIPLDAGAHLAGLVRLESQGALQLQPRLWSEKGFVARELRTRLLIGLHYGIVLGLLAYNLFLFFSVRDRAYLFYALFQLSVLVAQAGVDQLIYQYVLPGSPELVARIQVLFAGVLVASAAAFARDFLQTSRFVRLGHQLLGGVLVVGLALILAALFWKHVEGFGAVVMLVAPVLLLVVGIMAWLRGSPNGLFFMLAWLALLSAGTVGALTALGVLDAINVTDWGQRLGSALEAILLSLGLASRINRLQREHHQAQLALAQDRAERIESLNELVAGVAHEIGNPLNLTLGGSKELARRITTLATPPTDPEALAKLVAPMGRFSDLVLRGNQRIERIVANLRAYTQAETRPAERTDVGAAVNSAIALLQPRLTEAGITVEHQAVAAHAALRPGELDQVLANLLLNAWQAMPDGGRLAIRTVVDNAQIEVTIADTGPGVAEADRASIFRPFFSTRPAGEGSGLGLSVSSEIMRRNGGSVVLAPAAVGATFVLRLPVLPADAMVA